MHRLLFLLIGITGLFSCTQKNPRLQIKTEIGDIIVELYPGKAPLTVANFLRYVDMKRFDSACFYRVVTPENQPGKKVKIEVIQGGLQYRENIDNIPGVRHESTQMTGIHHLNGTISMARNQVGSASTEFFICVGDQPELDYGGKRNPDGQGFAAFGKTIKGMDLVQKIQHMPADSNQILRHRILIKEIRRMNE